MVLSLTINRFVLLIGVRIVLCFYIVLVFCHSILESVLHIVVMAYSRICTFSITFTPSCLTTIDLFNVECILTVLFFSELVLMLIVGGFLFVHKFLSKILLLVNEIWSICDSYRGPFSCSCVCFRLQNRNKSVYFLRLHIVYGLNLLILVLFL